jgi:glucose/arabinose dehydrogenase
VLWTAVNERDELGNDLVPDYITSVRDGAFYGWPYSYYGQHVDNRAKPARPDLVATATVPDYAVGSHTASLGFTFYEGEALPQYRGGAFVGQHGSWNRKPFSGYRVIYVPFENGKATGKPQDVLTGFVDERGEARGRPVGVAVDRKGALLVADDVGNHVCASRPRGRERCRPAERDGTRIQRKTGAFARPRRANGLGNVLSASTPAARRPRPRRR